MVHYIKSELLTRGVKVLLVGAGGTGSHMLRHLATMHLAMVELGHPEGLDVVVADPDVVSKSNVGRQNFYPSDIGHAKAEILVNRCNLTMQTGWKAEQQLITSNTPLNKFDLVIGCVDNRKGRAAIVKALSKNYRSSTYYLDIGNREHDGQIILGQVSSKNEVTKNRLPHVADLFPEIIDEALDDKDDAPSCSLAEALEKQSLFINLTMANMACNMLWELFRYGQISYHGQFVNIKSGRITPLEINAETWKRFGYEEPVEKKQRKKAA